MSATERTVYLNYYDIWTYKNEEDLKTLEKNLQDMKLDLYKNRINISYTNGLRKRIQSLKNGINKSYMNKNKLFEETLEYHATQLKNDFLYNFLIALLMVSYCLLHFDIHKQTHWEINHS